MKEITATKEQNKSPLNHKRVLELLFIIILAFFFISTSSFYGQELKIAAKIDTTSNEITTFVSLINIPEGGRVRFQQRLLPDAKVINLPLPSDFLLWDTAKNIITIIAAKYPRIDTLNFVFVCRTDTLSDTISWGEAAFMYENKTKEVKKISLPAKNYIVRQKNIELDSIKKQ